MSEWKEQKIADICSRVVSGGTPLKSKSEYYENGEIPWLKTGEIKKEYIYETEELITQQGLLNSSAKLIPQNSVIVAMYGDGGTAGSVAINKIDLTTNQACCNLILNKKVAFYRFVYFYLKVNYDNLVNLKLGGSQQNLNAQIVKSFIIRLPSLSTQKKVAAILSAYDDLIENNDRRIALLEKMAEEIYREWFVRLRFPGHEQVSFHKGIPANWEEKSLSDICVLQSGYAFKSSDFTDNEGGRIVVRMGNFKINHGLQFDNNTKYLASNVQVSEKFKLKPGDLLIVLSDVTRGGSIIGNIGIVPSSDKEFVLNQRASKIKVQKEYFFYLYGILSSISFKNHCLSRADSATVLNLSNKDFYEYKLLLPPDDLIGSFSDFYRPYRLAVMNLSIANQKLKQTRDRLLTRLISGKLSVTDLNIQFPPGMVEP